MERWERVKRLVDDALALDSSARPKFLDETCAGEPTLRAEVESLLGYERESLLESTSAAGRELAGTSLAHYRIIEEIGRGGMGRVYRALDETLGRHVAIKVLPEGFAQDPERLRRFEREARLIAALSHSRIATIHGLERADGVPFLVLELVEGDTLRERLRRGRLPVREALALALQIAEGLEAAHEKGVVHRDLKPSNVKVTEDDEIKVLDFGLAKALVGYSSDDDDAARQTQSSETVTTHEGMVLGTPPYMSPEQVAGGRVDHRTDIWSFGVVLYEMLAGCRPFEGASTSEVLGAVLRDEPDWERLPDDTPAVVRSLLQRCLTRERRRRLQSIGEARILIEDWLSEPEPHPHAPERKRLVRKGTVILAGLAVVAVSGLGVLSVVSWRGNSGTASPLVQTTLEVPPGAQLSAESGFELSPSGDRVAFIARDADGVFKLWIRSFAGEAYALEGTQDAFAPFWSPDGRDLAFFARRSLNRVPATGGLVQVLAPDATNPKGGAWKPDGTIVYVPHSRSGLLQVPATGGAALALTELRDAELSHRWPRVLPDGETLLFLVQTAEPGAPDDRSRVEVLAPSGQRRELLRVNSSFAFASPGRLLFSRGGRLYAQELELPSLRVRGEPQLLVEDVGFTGSEWATFSVADEGALVYHEALDPPRRFEWRDRSGKRWPVDAPEGPYDSPALSPDGRRVAYTEEITTIWILDTLRGTRTRLTFEAVDHFAPSWSPDGRWVAYAADAPEGRGTRIFRQPSSGLGERELLYQSETLIWDTSWSSEGRWIAFPEGGDIRVLDLETGETRVVVATPAVDDAPRFSPDGRWLAYASEESGRPEVYIVPIAGGARWQVSKEGGRWPRWSRTGEELFFTSLADEVWVSSVRLSDEPELGVPTPVIGLSPGEVYEFDVGPDGRFLVLAVESNHARGLRLIQNWPLLLQRPGR